MPSVSLPGAVGRKAGKALAGVLKKKRKAAAEAARKKRRKEINASFARTQGERRPAKPTKKPDTRGPITKLEEALRGKYK